jgi:hypothetical protein
MMAKNGVLGRHEDDFDLLCTGSRRLVNIDVASRCLAAMLRDDVVKKAAKISPYFC